MQLKPHQQLIVNKDHAKAPIAMGVGSGKTIIALSLARGKTLVIAPKQQKEDLTWEENAKKFGLSLDMTTMSKETFRRDWEKLPKFDTVIIDESHNFLGVYPQMVTRKGVQYPKSSQLYDAVYGYIQKFDPERLYFCSGTPIPHPMNLWALAKLLGVNWNFEQFRKRFYVERKMGYRSIWLEKKDKASKELLVKLFKEQLGAFTGQLSDWFEVPEQKHETLYVALTDYQKQALDRLRTEEADPMVVRAKMRCLENGIQYTNEVVELNAKESKMVRGTVYYHNEKLNKIYELVQKHGKAIIFAAYTGQIEAIRAHLEEKGVKVSTLTGATKDRAGAIRDIEEADSGAIIVQSSISAGWEAPSVRCMIFAGKSWKFVDYSQALGRNLRLNNLSIANNIYYHLVVKGGVDEDCHKAILNGEDFHEMVMES